jgi:hypothetical protein
MKSKICVAFVAMLMVAGPVSAVNLVVIQGVDPFASRFYGGSGWTDLTAEIDSTFSSVTVLPDASNLAAILAADRLWVDQRWLGGLLTQQEIDNITAFVSTGRRAVFIGENDLWADWNNQILGIVGGSHAGTSSGTANSLGTDPILNFGITAITLPTAGVAAGGTHLFDINWSTLWGNVVTVLDINVWENWTGDNAQYGRNVVEWLHVPSPGALAVFGIALVGARRRRD